MNLPGPLPGRVQVAGFLDQYDADLAIEAGVDMLGFPLGLKDGREDLSVAEAARIIRRLPPDRTAVCITYLDHPSDILKLIDVLGVNWVQLHGPVDRETLVSLRESRPDLGIIKSLIVKPDDGTELEDKAGDYEAFVDAFITDTFDPHSGRSGATGKTHDWKVSKRIVACTRKPVILAGGLNPENVELAIQSVRPYAVDAHTGVEGGDGRKDPERLFRFVSRALRALDDTA